MSSLHSTNDHVKQAQDQSGPDCTTHVCTHNLRRKRPAVHAVITVREANEDQQRVDKALLCMSARDILGDVGMLQAQITVLGPPDPID